jgi:hypothetical protein
MTQTPRLALASGALCALASSACLIPLGGEQIGEIRVGWSFPQDASCASVGVDVVDVQVVGKERAGGAEVPCVEGSTLIPSLPPGKYDIFIDAVGTDARFTAHEQIDVEAGFTSDEGVVTLGPKVGPDGARLALRWSFDGDASCARAGVSSVDVIVHSDDAAVSARSFSCTDGGATLSDLEPGDVSIDVIGRDGDVQLYQGSTTATLGLTLQDVGVVDLAPLGARTTVAWTFDGDPRCEFAGVTDVSVQVINDAGTTVAGAQADCIVGSVRFEALPAEHVTFVVEGLNGSVRAWQSSVAATLTPGDNPGVVVSLEPAFARAHVRWLFADAGGTGDCAAAGVASVTLQVFDAVGAIVAGGSFACAQGAAEFGGFEPGAHRFVADGFGPGGNLVAQDTTGNPRGVTMTLALGDNDVDVILE